MPVDPEISLQVRGGSSGPANAGYAPATPTNPLALVEGLVGIQDKMNSIQLFNQQMKARKRLGDIMAASKDIPSAVQTAQGDPQVNAFLPGELASMMGTLEAGQRYKGEVTKQNQDALTAVLGTLGTGFTDPSQLPTIFAARLKGIADPVIKANTTQTGGQILSALTDDLPDDPEAKKAEYAKRLTGLSLGTGIPGVLDAMKSAWSQPGTAKVLGKGGFNVTQPTLTAPNFPTVTTSAAPGSITPTGNALALGIDPGMYPEKALPTGPGVNPLLPDGAAAGDAGPAASAAAAAPTKPSSPLAHDGKPLIPEDYKFETPKTKTVGGVPIGPAADIAGQLASKYGTSKVLEDGQSLLGQLNEMDADLDNMEKGGGWTASGPAADSRAKLGAALNLGSTMLGGKAIVDPTAIASAEGFIKASQLSSVGTTTLMLGAQREAAETLTNMAKAVPSLNNSYLGAKLLIALRRAYTNRAMDQYKWETEHATRNGDLTGVDQKFVEEHPVSGYLNPVLEDNGIKEAVGKAYQAGQLGKVGSAEAREAAKKILNGFGQKKD